MSSGSNLLVGAAVIAALAISWMIHERGQITCPPDKACIRYMAWGNPEQMNVERGLTDRFEKENPTIQVDLVSVPGANYLQKETLMLATKTAPDVLRVDHYNFPKLVEDGYFADLTPYASRDPSYRAADFWPSAMAENTYQGRLYGLNVLFGGEVLYCNKTLFKSAGLTDPFILAKKGEWTWEQFRKDAIAMTRFGSDGEPITFGTLNPGMPSITAVLRGFGADWLNARHTDSALDDPRAAAALQFVADLVWKDHAAPNPAQSANNAFAFETGKVGMYFDWMGMTPRFRNLIKEFDWDVCTLPTDTKGENYIVKGNQLVVSASSPNKEAGWKFVRFMTGVEAETLLGDDLRREFPTRQAVAESPRFVTCTKTPYQVSAFVDCVKTGRILPIDDRWAEWTQDYNSDIDDLMAGRNRSAKAVLQKVVKDVDRTLHEPPGY